MKLLKKKLFCRTGEGRDADIFWKEGTGVVTDLKISATHYGNLREKYS